MFDNEHKARRDRIGFQIKNVSNFSSLCALRLVRIEVIYKYMLLKSKIFKYLKNYETIFHDSSIGLATSEEGSTVTEAATISEVTSESVDAGAGCSSNSDRRIACIL